MTDSNVTPSEMRSRVAGEMAQAFPLNKLEVPGTTLMLRPLAPDDDDRLLEILGGDRAMTWTRNEWDESNVAHLLRLRLDHYTKYGFGVYGVLTPDGALVGMAGAQFWDEQSPDVEVIAYIERTCWNQGWSTAILSATVARVFDECLSVSRIVAATRHDNTAAQAVARSLGMRTTGEGVHYGAPSIYWVLTRGDWKRSAEDRAARSSSQEQV